MKIYNEELNKFIFTTRKLIDRNGSINKKISLIKLLNLEVLSMLISKTKRTYWIALKAKAINKLKARDKKKWREKETRGEEIEKNG